MFKQLVLALVVASSAAFVPSHAPRAVRTSVVSNGALSEMPGVQDPVGLFDPMGLATSGSEETLLWFRAAELKHSRVTMLATSGWLVNALGIYFPGDLTKGVKFSSLGSNPLDAWAAVPFAGKLQIIAFCGAVEFFAEVKKPHYMKGGPMGLQFDPLGIYNGMSPEMRKTRMNRELANGRLAMIAIVSFFSASFVPGSVPFIP